MTKLPGEFELVARLCRELPLSKRVILGPGDDCAILAPARRPQLVTIDSMVEGVHFRLEWGPAKLVGERALTVNLSDIAAMGGYPTACVVNLAIRDGVSRELIDALWVGFRTAAKKGGVNVVGGNITRAAELAITVALLGELHGAALRRDAARPGDEIYVTGTLGDAAAGWRILERKLSAAGSPRKFLIGRALKPTARLAAGQALARVRPAPAAIDISDGLLQDLGHILERSHVGAEIDPAAIPVSAAYRTVMGQNLDLALSGGEDYELLFCIRPGMSEKALASRLGISVRGIGRIVRGRAKISLKDGRLPESAGWDQLRARD